MPIPWPGWNRRCASLSAPCVARRAISGAATWRSPSISRRLTQSEEAVRDPFIKLGIGSRRELRTTLDDLFAFQAKPSASSIAWAKSSGASCGRLWPMPPVRVRCTYLPVNRPV